MTKHENKKLKGDTTEDDLDLILSPYKRNHHFTHLSVSIDEDIKEPKYYRLIVEEISELRSGDSLQIRINSMGGRVDGLITLLDAIENTEANVIAHIVGECYSAASMLALNCPNISVSDYASMMVHHVSYGAVGKDSDVVSHVLYNSSYCKNLFINTYKYFLTDKEIEEVLAGKELWFNADEIRERIQNKSTGIQKELAKINKQRKAKAPLVE